MFLKSPRPVSGSFFKGKGPGALYWQEYLGDLWSEKVRAKYLPGESLQGSLERNFYRTTCSIYLQTKP